ncbi:hypothetical protein [Conyzicola sp.]|uniref:hypothetical protein n=1 Tax=Conyzicola sp. TaxID=1969404 RepID=UPI003989BBD1
MINSETAVDAALVADIIDAELTEVARSWGLGETRSVVILTRGSWPVVITIAPIDAHTGVSVSIREEPFTGGPAGHAGPAMNLVCALLDQELSIAGTGVSTGPTRDT